MAGDVVQDYIDYIRTSIIDFFKILLKEKYSKKKIVPIVDRYISVRYLGNTILKSQDFVDIIIEEIVEETTKLMSEVNDSDYVSNVCIMFHYIMYLDDCIYCDNYNTLLNDLFNDSLITFELDDDTKSELKKLVKTVDQKKTQFQKLFDTSDFEMVEKRISKGLYNVDIVQHCKIPNLYSEYAINKAFNTQVVKEDKTYVLYLLLANTVLRNTISLDFSRNYIVTFPESLFSKSKKILRYINVFKNDLVKNQIALEFTYSCYIKNESIINTFIKSGINVALILDDKFDDDYGKLVLFKYIFIDKENELYDEIVSKIKSLKLDAKLISM